MGLSTAPLIATGCIMMRVCHLNTCPVGVATQDPELRARFKGTPDQVVTYMLYVAEETRELMASLGIRTMPEMTGQTHLLDPTLNDTNWKTRTLDLRPLLAVPPIAEGRPKGFVSGVPFAKRESAQSFDLRLLVKKYNQHKETDPDFTKPLVVDSIVTNGDLAIGGSLSNAIVSDRGPEGLPEGSIKLNLRGSAGQTAGGWLIKGVEMSVEGDVNDYAGKGLSGGVLAVYPAGESHFEASKNVIAGNVALYGATSGRAFFAGRVGERFAVRNSGALTVVEGVGEHACEYMTGGIVVVIGPTGQNFGAGMSGGVAYVHNPDKLLAARTNHQLVDLDPVGPERREQLRGLIEEHLQRTGSDVARELLSRWEEAVERVHAGDPARLQGSDGPDAGRSRGRRGRSRRRRARNRGSRLMADPKGFLQVHRVPAPERDPAERVKDYGEIYETLPEEGVQEQARRCMDCGVPFCNNACPLGNLIPDWNDLARTGHWREGIDQLHATNNFPEFTGLICPAPCESACVLAIDDDPVMIKQIEYWTIDNAFKQGWVTPEPPADEDRTGQKVAVIGSGPAGLAAADELNQVGHTVIVFERDEGLGGLLRFGVPDAKLEKWIIDRRTDVLAAEGIDFRCNVEVGRRHHGRGADRTSTTRSCSRWARGSSATSRSPAASSPASTSRWSTCTSATARSPRWRAASSAPSPPRTSSPPTARTSS